MFADSMLETSWAQRTRRSWTTMTSFGLQAVMIGLFAAIATLEDGGLAVRASSANTGIVGSAAARCRAGPTPRTQQRSSKAILADNVLIAPSGDSSTILRI